METNPTHHLPYTHTPTHLPTPSLADMADPPLLPLPDHPIHCPVPGGCSGGDSPELRQALLLYQAELRRAEAEAARLAAERDELRRQCQSLLLLLHHHHHHRADAEAPQGGGVDAGEEAVAEMGAARRLPERGRLVEAVVAAGPLLQTLLLAGPLPRWRRPPPPPPPGGADIPPFNPRMDVYAAAAAASPESDSVGAMPLLGRPYHDISPFCL